MNKILQQQIKQAGISPFNKACYLALLQVPAGKVISYKTLASLAGNAKAARAVGNAMNNNPFSPDIPCHRVISNNGNIGGYAYGLDKKKKLLINEGVLITEQKVNQCDILPIEYFI